MSGSIHLRVSLYNHRRFDDYVQQLHNSNAEKMEIPKMEVDELPDEFEEAYPANAMQDGNAVASYRDNESEDSVHVIEYDNHWEAHLDDVNPKHDPLRHLLSDAPAEAATLALFLLLVANYYGTFEN